MNSRPIDFAKIDIEGHELDALVGFGDAIDATKAVQFEFGGTMIDTRTFYRDYFEFFGEALFDLYRITPLGPQLLSTYREFDENYMTTNFIAVNKR